MPLHAPPLPALALALLITGVAPYARSGEAASDVSVPDFVVAPDGDDAYPGTLKQPFATVTRAREAVRTKTTAGLSADVTVLLRGGTYRVTEPLVFGPEDGGTNDFSITYAAYPGERPVITDVGGNGIMVGEGQARQVGDAPWWEAAPDQAAGGNVVANSLVEHCGRELFGAVGIWVGLAGKTSIVHNEVRHLPYTGVSVGWMWWNPRSRPEPRKTPCVENVVAYNHIHDVMQVLSDGGGIYTLGTQPGSALCGNLIHDVPTNAGRAESNGMFLDQGTGQFVIERNVIYGVARSPLRFHKGWNNMVRDNVLEVGRGVPPVRYNDTRAERIVLEGNNVVETVSAAIVEEARRRAGPEPTLRERLDSGQDR